MLLASLTLILLFWQWRPIPTVIWNIELRPSPELATAGGILGWLIVLYSTFLISHFELFGLTQVITHFAGRSRAHQIQDAGPLSPDPSSDLSRLHHRVLVDTGDDARTPDIRIGDDGLHLRRHLA